MHLLPAIGALINDGGEGSHRLHLLLRDAQTGTTPPIATAAIELPSSAVTEGKGDGILKNAVLKTEYLETREANHQFRSGVCARVTAVS